MARVMPIMAKLTVLNRARPNSGRLEKSGVTRPAASSLSSSQGSNVVMEISAARAAATAIKTKKRLVRIIAQA